MGRSDEFMFWKERLSVSRGRCEDESSESQLGASSPTLWRRGRIELSPETSTLLPQNHQYSCLSPTSRLRAILDGRRELMEMIKDMPESSHELTLKDIVDKQDIQESKAEEEEREKHKRENRIPKSNNTKQICRSESMESQVFLLKMFLPISLTSKKKKTKTKKKAYLEGPEIQANKQWWKIILVAIRLRDNHRNTNIITNPTSEKKCKSRGQGGCLF